MSTEVKKIEKNSVQVIDFTAKATEYLTAMGLQLPEKHKKMFVELSQAYGLNPFKREIYAVGYGNNFNVITGYEVYLKRAERTGLLDGYETNWEEDANGGIKSCTCTVYRKDRQHPTKQKVYFSEYNLGTAIWKSKPHTMIEKVAIAQAFRKAFPDELGGMPYTAEEMSEQNIIETTAEVIETNPIPTQHTVQQPKQPAQQPAAQPKQIDPEMQKAIDKLKKLFDSGVFNEEEKTIIRTNWKTNWKQAISDAEEAYKLKTTPQEEPEQPQSVSNDEPPF